MIFDLLLVKTGGFDGVQWNELRMEFGRNEKRENLLAYWRRLKKRLK